MKRHAPNVDMSHDATITLDGRYTNRQMIVPSNYKDIVKLYNDKGFDIPFVRGYLDDRNNENLEMHIKLPYFYNGQDVWGYAVVDCKRGHNISQDIRSYNTCEIWIGEPDRGGRNIEDIAPDSHQMMTFIDKDGKSVDVDTMYLSDEVGLFAGAASNYPYVCSWDEYKAFKTVSNAKLGFEPPTEDAYMKYLDTCRGLMKDCRFIGEVRTLEGIDEMSMTTPSNQQFLEEMAQADNERFLQSIEAFGLPESDESDFSESDEFKF